MADERERVPVVIQEPATDKKVVLVRDFAATPDDINDWVCVRPSVFEMLVVSHYHYYRVGMESVGFNGPAGAPEEDVRYLPEGDNAEDSELVVADPVLVDETTFVLKLDARKTQVGDNFILYFNVKDKDTIDWRWTKRKVTGRSRSFQVHLHIGDTVEEYVKNLQA